MNSVKAQSLPFEGIRTIKAARLAPQSRAFLPRFLLSALGATNPPTPDPFQRFLPRQDSILSQLYYFKR